jgi:hypothetical protein
MVVMMMRMRRRRMMMVVVVMTIRWRMRSAKWRISTRYLATCTSPSRQSPRCKIRYGDDEDDDEENDDDGGGGDDD